jgi:SulP family sulfate permease
MRNVMAMDSTGMHALRDLVRRTRHDGTLVFLTEVRAQPMVAMDRAGVLDAVGEGNVHGSMEQAIEAARTHLAGGAKRGSPL